MDDVFSPMEKEILKILGRRKMSITDITDKYLEKNESNALIPNNVVSGAIKNINKKCQYHKFKWFINGMGSGRGGKTVWKES